MGGPLSLRGIVSPLAYALSAPVLLLVPHGLLALLHLLAGRPLVVDAQFWLLPLYRVAWDEQEYNFSPALTAMLFLLTLLATWLLAALSFKRASASGIGHEAAVVTVVPVLQFAAVAFVAALPVRGSHESEDAEQDRAGVGHVLQGLLAGAALIVVAVLVSTLTLGAYGWGLFVLTPFVVGVTTGYVANRDRPLEFGRTSLLVLAAAGLGAAALVAFALEGIVCILMAAPLAAPFVLAGGALGRSVALAGHRRGRPFLTVAVLPAIFALEAAIPPSVSIETETAIDIAAPPVTVWHTLTSGAPIASRPGIVGRAGLAYPVGSRILRAAVGGERIGHFSTGPARERITAWAPARRLAFEVVEQPPAMEEMSPYRRVHAPHVQGYFDTGETRFDLEPLPGGGTRLVARASHVLRIDPAVYWEPLARWAVRRNVERVLEDVKARAEAGD